MPKIHLHKYKDRKRLERNGPATDKWDEVDGHRGLHGQVVLHAYWHIANDVPGLPCQWSAITHRLIFVLIFPSKMEHLTLCYIILVYQSFALILSTLIYSLLILLFTILLAI